MGLLISGTNFPGLLSVPLSGSILYFISQFVRLDLTLFVSSFTATLMVIIYYVVVYKRILDNL